MNVDPQASETIVRSREADATRSATKGPRSQRVRAASAAGPGRHKGTQRWRLAQAMVELSARGGFHEVSIAHLCAGAGVSSVTFYEQFADKEDVLVSAYRACAESVF